MNNSKRILALVLSGVIISSTFVGCTTGMGFKTANSNEPSTAELVKSDAPEETLEAVEPIEKQILTFEDKDSKGNTMVLSPIYDNDGETIIAGYIIEVKDKKGKALTAKEFPLLHSLVKAERSGDTAKVVFDSKGNLISIQSYSDEKGNFIAIQDSLDLDGDADTTEYLKMTKKIDSNNMSKIIVEYKNVQVKTEKGNTVVVDNDKKVNADKVDSDNKNAANAEKNDVEKNEVVKKNHTTTTQKQTTTKKPSSNSTTKPSTTKKPSQSTTNAPKSDEISIVLKRNSQASCSSSKVSISDKTVTIKDEGDFVITSETDLWHGHIVVKLPNTKKCSIKFKDVDISYNQGNIIQIIDTSISSDRTFLETEVSTTDSTYDNELRDVSENDSAPDVDLSFPEGTSSSFISDANSYTGVIYNESKLTIKGNGRLSVESRTNSDNCICTTKSVTIKNCTVSLATAQNQNPSKLAAGSGAAKGIFSYGKVTLDSGTLNIKTNGDGIRCARFICNGGTANVSSSACDAFDSDNEISINAGRVVATAVEKSAFKVRRVNAGKQRAGKNDTFEINGGTVIGEGKKSTPVQTTSSQESINASIRSTNPEKTYGSRANIVIKNGSTNLAKSANMCTTFIYSSSAVSTTKSYTMSAINKSANVSFNQKVGTASFAG